MNQGNTCTFDPCERPAQARGLCNPHYLQWNRGKDLKPLRKPKAGRVACSFSGCEMESKAKGICSTHYAQYQRNGMDGLRPSYATKRRARQACERDADGNKHCIKCDTWKPETDFTMSRSAADKLDSRCRECKRDDGMTREERRIRRMENRFNLPHERYLAILESQGNACAVCKTTEPSGHTWCIDHDHSCCPGTARSCGKCVRAILCTRCNCALGLVDESAETLRAMLQYIDTHKEPVA